MIRGSKLWRQYEVDEKDRLTWANEIPGCVPIRIVLVHGTAQFQYRRLSLPLGMFKGYIYT